MHFTQPLFILVAAFAVSIAAAGADASIETREITYTDGEVELQGYFAWDDSVSRPRAAVLIVHAWWGLGEDEKARARELAGLGYAAFALDMYGTGKITSDPNEAAQWAAPFYADRDLARSRAAAGLKVLTEQREVDPDQVAAIGYCFGGTIVVELAYSGADLAGVVSFHGNPLPAQEGDAARTQAPLLILHGAADTLVSMEDIRRFTEALKDTNVDWQLVVYSGAKHAFTTRSVDAMNIPGAAYDPAADQRSWRQMRTFFEEVF